MSPAPASPDQALLVEGLNGSFADRLLYITLFTPPLFLAIFLQAQHMVVQMALLCALGVCLALGPWLRKQESRIFGTTPYVSSLFLLSCSLVIALVVWNRLFLRYSARVSFRGDIFRAVFQNLHAPIYGSFHQLSVRNGLYLLVCAGLFAVCLPARGRVSLEQLGYVAPIGLLLALSIRMIFTDNPSRATEWVAHYGSFAAGIHRFTSVSDLLRNYTSQMSLLGVHANHYPPGILLMLKMEESLKVRGLTRLIVLLSGIGTLWVLRRVVTSMGSAQTCSALAVYLFIFSPGVLTYMTSDPGFIVVFFCSLILYVFLKSVKTGSVAYAFALGFLFSIDFFFSFSALFVALLLGIVLLLLWRKRVIRISHCLVLIGVSAVIVLASYTLLYQATGFNLLECFRVGRLNNIHQMSNPFDSIARYLFRSTGAILAYLVSAGVVQSCFAIWTAKRRVPREQPDGIVNVLAKGLIICLLVCGFSGAFFLETERIWVIFTPPLVVAAAYTAQTVYEKRGFRPTMAVLASAMFFALAYQVCFEPVFWG